MTVPANGVEFSNTWNPADDRVMGGQSWSWCYLENDYGKFKGEASSDGGGFSLCRTGTIRDGGIDISLTGYDGLVFDVASQNARTLKFNVGDKKERWFSRWGT